MFPSHLPTPRRPAAQRLVFWCHASLGWCLLALTFTKFSNTVFTGGVFRRSTFGFFQRIVVRGGTFGAFAWVCS